MSKFPNMYSPSLKIVTNPGNRIHITYGSRFDKKGNIELVATGKEDIHKFIQSNADSVDINILVEKYKNGDLSALNKRKAIFIDETQMPEDYFDMMNKISEVKEIFNKLPAETKQAFDNSADKFIASVGKDDFINKIYGLKQHLKDDDKKVDEPVKPPEPNNGGNE